MAKTTPTQAGQGVEAFFGRSPEEVVQPLHNAVEAMSWMVALFECIGSANADQNTGLVHALSGLGAYVAAEHQVTVIGEHADAMQACVEATRAGGEA